MSLDLLDDSVLYISARSPFARRVRLPFLESGIRFEERVLDMLGKPDPRYMEVNPIHRVPALVLKSGETVIDSHEILQVFQELAGDRGFIPWDFKDRLVSHYWSGVSVGLCEKIVERFFELLRPQAARDRELLEEIETFVASVLRRLDAHLEGRDTLVESGICQADFDTGTMLGYLSIRVSEDWKREFRNAARYLESLEARPSFVATRPPAAV